jgi:PIN domain nuclease of toxin-antitoxin system
VTRFLLDTHSFLWFIGGDRRLSEEARATIADLNNDIVLSVASLWEIAIIINIGKVKLPHPFGELIPEQLRQEAVAVLPIEMPHLTQYTALPLHHRDPFDRLIIAQAQIEAMPIIGADESFQRYDVDLLW